MKAAIIVGHSPKKQGAYNEKYDESEFHFNSMIANLVLIRTDIDIEVVYRTNGYSKLPTKVNATNADIAFSLHCNAFDKKASGTETLSSGSYKSNQLAEIIQPKILEVFGLPNRGIKIRKRKDLGGLILHKTKMPIVLLEPFFIDNDSDMWEGLKKQEEYADAIIETINEYIKL